MKKKTKTLNLNFGPQHPAAHGVLRLILELDGERVLPVTVKVANIEVVVKSRVLAPSLLT